MSYDYKGLHSFTYNGVNFANLGLYIKKHNSYDSPARSVTKINVPGRNGTIIIDNGNYENINVSYDCRLLPLKNEYSGFEEQTAAVKAALYTDVGNYHTLTDTYGKSHIAAFTAALNFKEVVKGSLDVTVTFDCKPDVSDEEL